MRVYVRFSSVLLAALMPLTACDGDHGPSLSLLAGPLGGAGFADGVGAEARFNFAYGLAYDGAGHLFVADSSNHIIRRIAIASGRVTTLAGRAGQTGGTDGTGLDARFRSPRGLALDAQGNLFVADFTNHTIRQVVIATGAVTTLAGKDGEMPGSRDGTGEDARFNEPSGLFSDGVGKLFVADRGNHTIRQIVIASGEVTTFAGKASEPPGHVNGTGEDARFDQPQALAGDGKGTLFVADFRDNGIRMVDLTSRQVTTLPAIVPAGAHAFQPTGVATDGRGTLFVVDPFNEVIQKMDLASGGVTILAGDASQLADGIDGIGAAAHFSNPDGLALDDQGHLYVADDFAIRSVEILSGEVSTLAGSAGPTGSSDGIGTAARFFQPMGATSDGQGHLFIADRRTSIIRSVEIATGLVTTLAGVPFKDDSTDGTGAEARFNFPVGLATDGQGNLFVSDTDSRTIRRVVIATGAVSTVAGQANDPSASVDGIGEAARFSFPYGLASDGRGALFIIDGNAIRTMAIATKEVRTLAGSADEKGAVDGVGEIARFNGPSGIAADGEGHLFVADTANQTIRMISVSTKEVSTVAGVVGEVGSSDGVGAAARFDRPFGIASDGLGNLLVADYGNHAIRKIVVATGEVSLFAGNPEVARIKPGPLPAELAFPIALTVTPSGIAVLDGNSVVLIH
jgi:sugar lactone lactonase YvrE